MIQLRSQSPLAIKLTDGRFTPHTSTLQQSMELETESPDKLTLIDMKQTFAFFVMLNALNARAP